MSLIDRYLQEVRTYLPKNQREDVTRELHARLDADLTRRQAESPGRSRREIEIELLTDFGPPSEIADTYVARPRVLFGPRLYPLFMRTMKISGAVLMGSALLGMAVDLSHSFTFWTLIRSLASAFGTVLTGGLVVLAISIVVFASMERSGAPAGTRVEPWDPRQLPADDDPDKVALGEAVASIAFLVVALVVVNLFPNLLGARVTLNGESGWVSLVGAGFHALVWLLDLCLAADLLVNILLLIHRRKSLALRFAGLGVNALWITWLWQLTRLPTVLRSDPSWMVEHGWSAAAAEDFERLITGPLSRVVEIGLEIGLIVALVAFGVQLVKLGGRMLRGS